MSPRDTTEATAGIQQAVYPNTRKHPEMAESESQRFSGERLAQPWQYPLIKGEPAGKEPTANGEGSSQQGLAGSRPDSGTAHEATGRIAAW